MKKFFSVICVLIILQATDVKAYKVSSLAASYKDGQVFLTWTNPTATHLKYRVYRSTSKITSSSQLNSGTYIGYVLDNSAKNIRKSNLKGTSVYYTIDPLTGPLSSTKGLYVVSCNDNQTWYYAVTVEDLLTNVESKSITLGKNSLNVGVQETLTAAQPVLQATVNHSSGDVIYEYVIFGDNRSNSYKPAFNNCGFYGYNFSFISHTTGSVPLYVLFKDSNPFQYTAAPEQCGECNVLVMDDWLPNGQNTYWFGYHENYDMYSTTNTANTSGTVRSYTMSRVKWTIDWVVDNYGLDATRIYSSGFSHNGFGAVIAGMAYPDLFAATWANVPPILVKALNGSSREKMWCPYGSNLLTDVLDPNTNLPLPIWTFFDFRQMLRINHYRGVPYLGGISGKNDVTIGWVQYFSWFDSVEASRQGGLWMWDQRNHNGVGKNFTSEEAGINYSRFSTAKSYPAFSYCSINQNPGNSNTSTGDPYGALNGYLDWDDNSISDLSCSYSITCNVKDMYANGVLLTSYDSCTTDITFRRLQNFNPTLGSTINWTVANSENEIVQSGSYLFDGEPPTVYSAKIYRSGSTITLQVQNCFGRSEAATSASVDDFNLSLMRTSEGYKISFIAPENSPLHIRLAELNGRVTFDRSMNAVMGQNEIEVHCNSGISILQVQLGNRTITKKLMH